MSNKPILILIVIFLVLSIFTFSFSKALSFGSGLGAKIIISNETADDTSSSNNSDNSDDSSSSSSSSSRNSNRITGNIISGSANNTQTNNTNNTNKVNIKRMNPSEVKTTADLEKYILSLSTNSTIKSIKVKSDEITIISIQKTKILGFIPKNYELSVTVDIDQKKYSNNRIKIKHPWYAKPGLDGKALHKEISNTQELNDLDLQENAGKQAKIISILAEKIEPIKISNRVNLNITNTRLISIPGL